MRAAQLCPAHLLRSEGTRALDGGADASAQSGFRLRLATRKRNLDSDDLGPVVILHYTPDNATPAFLLPPAGLGGLCVGCVLPDPTGPRAPWVRAGNLSPGAHPSEGREN